MIAFDDLDWCGCPGCDNESVPPEDLCGCDDFSGPMCDRCCRAYHRVGTRAWVGGAA